MKTLKYEAVVMGVSAGGFEALETILSPLPTDLPIPVIIVQHLHRTSKDYLIKHFNDSCKLPVKQADDKESLVPGRVYIAAPGYHLLIEEDRTLALSVDIPVNYSCPSIDVLFESAADVYTNKLIGVILTGANNDGSLGLKKIKEKGGITIAQAPITAEFVTMPEAAISIQAVDFILPLKNISSFILDIVENSND